MSSYVKSILFALITAVICSLLLTAGAAGLKRRQLENIEVDKKKNILRAVGLLENSRQVSKQTIQELYKKSIRSLWVSPDGQIIKTRAVPEKSLPIYLYVKDQQVAAYILPINTRGLWGKIFGYLAIESDGSTVAGFTVYKHSETPGLGGEIEKEWFQKNFEGKQILDRMGNLVSVSIAKGYLPDSFPEDKLPNYVDGISGATLTGKFLSAGLKDILLEYEPVSIQFRSRQTIQIEEP
jgi:Na+-transporting NADH:ubiquinone oxidoreductase subunit C